jgi:hypothetical protein
MTNTNQTQKKSETLEFRLTYDEKTEFLARVADQDSTASDVLRQLVVDFNAPKIPKRSKRPWIIGGLTAALGLISLPVLADRTLFAAYDLDRNGRITAGEISTEGDREIISVLDADKNGWVSFLELKASGSGELVSESRDDTHDGVIKRWLDVTVVDFKLGRDRHVECRISTGRASIPLDSTPEQISRIQANLRERMATPQSLSGAPSGK